MRNSKGYAAFKAFNGLVFVALGAAIIFRLATRIGVRIESLSGFVLGAALIALGLYRTFVFVRARR